jgi:hypothetical protein
LVPLLGISTARLVAPGAMSPVSIEPSFSATRCVTLSLFLKTTDWPPKFAGFGSNDRVPFCPMIVIVAAPDPDPEGPPGLLFDPPHADARSAAENTADVNTGTRMGETLRRLGAIGDGARRMPAEIAVCVVFLQLKAYR